MICENNFTVCALLSKFVLLTSSYFILGIGNTCRCLYPGVEARVIHQRHIGRPHVNRFFMSAFP